MKRGTALLLSFGMFLAACVYSGVMYRHLPNPAPSHWDINGKVDGYSSPLTVCLLGPAMMLGMLVLMIVLPKVSPKNFKIDSWSGVYNQIMVLIMALLSIIHLAVLGGALGQRFDMLKVLISAIYLFFAIIGNLMGKVRRNFWVGVRTPWTLASESVWNVVHRRAGRLWVIFGIIGAVAIWLGLPFWASFTMLMVVTLYPVLDSYLVWRRMDRPSDGAEAA